MEYQGAVLCRHIQNKGVKKMNKTAHTILKFAFFGMLIFTCFYTLNSCIIANSGLSTSIDLDTINLVQLDEIDDDAPVAVITTDFGTIKAVLYPEYAPETVAYFTELAESGYYDNSHIFYIEGGTYFAGGTQSEDGLLPSDFNEEKESIENELTQDLWPFKGALCSMGKGLGYSGSRFFFVNTIDFTEDVIEEMRSLITEGTENPVIDSFIDLGGIPDYSQQFTVFGQTYEGFDVIEDITAQEYDEENNNLPINEIIIESIVISTYGEQQNSSAEN